MTRSLLQRVRDLTRGVRAGDSAGEPVPTGRRPRSGPGPCLSCTRGPTLPGGGRLGDSVNLIVNVSVPDHWEQRFPEVPVFATGGACVRHRRCLCSPVVAGPIWGQSGIRASS
jgi:hypothetical protein